jgi:hypothetical protein
LPLHASRTVGLIASKKGNINIQKAFSFNVQLAGNTGTVRRSTHLLIQRGVEME